MDPQRQSSPHDAGRTARPPLGAAALCIALAACAAFLLTSSADDEPSRIKSDERVMLLPTHAHIGADGESWVIPIHGWIFEPETNSTVRAYLLQSLADTLELKPETAEHKLFQARAAYFLVDNERGKRVPVTLAGQTFVMPESQDNGHFTGEARLSVDDAQLQKLAAAQHGHAGNQTIALPASVHPDYEAEALASIELRLVGREGVTVISDIDDTIKASNVLDRRELVSHTFLRDFEAVSGMGEAYQQWASQGAVFHYVSSSPWQLYPELRAFMAGKFPPGAMHLKLFRAKDSSLLQLFASAEDTKPPVINAILATWPERRFILVGDSGEKDPEVYGLIARAHPDQVLHIFIRSVHSSDLTDARFERALADIPAAKWTLFTDPAELRSLSFTPPDKHVNPK